MTLNLMNKERIRSAAGLASLMLLLPSCVTEAEKKQPNIILFLADDLGYGDLSCYSPEGCKTPAIQSIADQGVRFTSFYSNGASSTPTRTALLTGRYQHRVGGMECAIGINNVGRYDDAIRLRETDDLGLPVSETSVANMIKKAGYNTGMFGKWHLGYNPKFNPNLHGFDEAMYALGGSVDYFHHKEKQDPNAMTVLFYNGEPVNNPVYFTSLIGEESIKFIDKQSDKKPFFLYVPFTAPHAPYQGPDDYLPEILPDSSFLWDQSRGPKHTYQAMIESMDKSIGEILSRLGEKNLSENTIVIFMSDNGGTTSGSNKPLRGFKGNLFEGGIRVPCVIKWPGKIPAGHVSDQICASIDVSASILKAAGASVPENRKPDGIDILKLIESGKVLTERTLFWRDRRAMTTRKAVRNGNLKYIWLNNDGKIEEYLFNISDDMEEKTNLLNDLPEEAGKLKTLLMAWEKEVEPVR